LPIDQTTQAIKMLEIYCTCESKPLQSVTVIPVGEDVGVVASTPVVAI